MRQDPEFAQAVEITTATYDRVAANYAERNETRAPHWTERMEQFVAALSDAAAGRPLPDLEQLGRPGDDATLDEYLLLVPVLDAGCGPGRDARALAAHSLPVLGVDLSQGMLDEAIERTARRLPHGSIRYALMDLRRLELPDASCRGVWCSASLLHLPRRTAPRAMRELARVARSGAPLVVFLKTRREDEAAERFLPYEHPTPETPAGARRFFAYYTPEEARALLADAGLDVRDVATVPDVRNPANPGWVSLLARKPV
jgi:SAM-dependent methyltransferase